jgi:hypothetical protein
MSYKMYLDDVRNPPDGTWVVCRSMAAAVEYIQEYGFPYFISFDHDLGMKLKRREDSVIVIASEDEEAPSGYDFVKWLCAQDQETPWMAKNKFDWNIHSANPVGAKAMHQYLVWYNERFVQLIEDGHEGKINPKAQWSPAWS